MFRGRRLKTITVGMMPGRQVTIYNKRKAAIEQRKLFWFKVWDIDRHDRSIGIWRVKLRAGKNVSGQQLRPLWNAVLEHLDTSLFEFRSGLTPG